MYWETLAIMEDENILSRYLQKKSAQMTNFKYTLTVKR